MLELAATVSQARSTGSQARIAFAATGLQLLCLHLRRRALRLAVPAAGSTGGGSGGSSTRGSGCGGRRRQLHRRRRRRQLRAHWQSSSSIVRRRRRRLAGLQYGLTVCLNWRRQARRLAAPGSHTACYAYGFARPLLTAPFAYGFAQTDCSLRSHHLARLYSLCLRLCLDSTDCSLWSHEYR